MRFSILFEQLLLWNIYRVTQYGERKYIYFIKYIIIYNKFNYIFYILYIHSYCLMINPTVCCKVCSKNEYTFFQVINTYIHISFIPSYTYIYTTYCIRFYIYIISNVSYFIFHHHLSLSQRKIFLVNSEKTEQSADSPQLLPDWVAQLPLYVHRSPFPPPSLFAYVQRVQSILNKKISNNWWQGKKLTKDSRIVP